jgi:hypothetical protein
VIKQRENIDKLVVPKTLRLRLGDVVVPYGTRFRLRRALWNTLWNFIGCFKKVVHIIEGSKAFFNLRCHLLVQQFSYIAL